MKHFLDKIAIESASDRGLLGELRFWVIALAVGVAAGFATVGFRLAIDLIQERFYGAGLEGVVSAASNLPWYYLIAIPAFGGLLVGIIITRFTEDGRVHTVAHVIEGAALNNGRISGRAGIGSTLASLITLSTGGSTGREGPAVQIGALISSKVAKMIRTDGVTGRELMGCAAAAAVSASFNAPLAGAIFALEVILRHYAISAFAPIAIAAASGTVVSRLFFGDITEYTLIGHSGPLAVELPAFILLGLLCGVVSVLMMRVIFYTDDMATALQKRLGIPMLLRPVLAGVMLGCIAIYFPHIIGVGYETTSLALTGDILFWPAIIFVVVKVFAVAITMAGRMGGGIFSPALMVGALTGLAFGWIATALVSSIEGDVVLYALAGMGAVGGAVLGAPISTTLLVFELTGDWEVALGVLVTVSLSSLVATRLVHRSFFLAQLARRGIYLAAGPQDYLLGTLYVKDLMRVSERIDVAARKNLIREIEEGHYLDISSTLKVAMPMFEGSEKEQIPIVQLEDGQLQLVGALAYLDALKAFNKSLSDTAREEHS